MSQSIDISNEDHPGCREKLLSELEETEAGETLTVSADHDPEPVLHQYRDEAEESIEWTYELEGPEEWELTVEVSGTDSPESEKLDVRELPPPERHGTILEKFQDLEVGTSLTIVNDHDPKPLFYELRSIHGDTFGWDYLQQDHEEYRVEISKTDGSREMPDEASTRVDVRVIPPNDRHTTIFHRFDLLAAGDAMEIVADHDPAPLRHQLLEVHGNNAFEWDYLLQERGEVRVLLKKTAADTESPEDGETDETAEEFDDENLEELDVRSYRPQKRHDLVYEQYGSLDEGEAFVLVNDHDPKPLYYQMREEMEGEVEWDYRQQGGDEWKVRIGKG